MTNSANALDATSNAPAPEIEQLVARLDETVDVRPDVIGEVSRRLAAGSFASRASAERTAEAMLRSSD